MTTEEADRDPRPSGPSSDLPQQTSPQRAPPGGQKTLLSCPPAPRSPTRRAWPGPRAHLEHLEPPLPAPPRRLLLTLLLAPVQWTIAWLWLASPFSTNELLSRDARASRAAALRERGELRAAPASSSALVSEPRRCTRTSPPPRTRAATDVRAAAAKRKRQKSGKSEAMAAAAGWEWGGGGGWWWEERSRPGETLVRPRLMRDAAAAGR